MPREDHFVDASGKYASHSLLTDGLIETRQYQIDLVQNSRDDHTLVTLPTGLGKTTVSLLLTAERMAKHRGKVLLLAPTKPLVQQHADFYREALDIFNNQIVVFTGDVRPNNRADLWEESTVIIATPQVIENDLLEDRIDLSNVVHCTFDECHRATGDYSYNYIAERYHQDADEPLVTAMSASPGGDKDTILEVCENLGIENVEVRTEDDSDVADYQYETTVDWLEISLPDEILEIRDTLKQVVKDRMTKLKEMGVANSATKDVSQKQLNGMRGDAQRLINNDDSAGYKAMSVIAEVDKLNPGIKTLESQGVEAFVSYMERNVEADARSSSGSKASQRLVADDRVQSALRRARNFDGQHPKLMEARDRVLETVANTDDTRILVFTESRDTAETLTEYLDEYFDAHKFVGQQDKESSSGMSQKQQKATLERFSDGEFDVLVSTSVAEEGLDVPEVDLVLFYEPVPQSVRAIQRKGRTGRGREGAVTVLVAADNRDGKGGSTIDETYYWISRRRERTMKSEIEELKDIEGDIVQELRDDTEQVGLEDFASGTDSDEETDDESGVVAGQDDEHDGDADVAEPQNDDSGDDEASEPAEQPVLDGDDIEIVADKAEMDSKIPRKLSTMEGVDARVETLETGDYVLSDRVAVERKEVDDFLQSMIDGDRDLFQQFKEVSNAYDRPVLIIEGDGLYTRRNIHPNAIRSTIASIAIDFGGSVLRTRDSDDTAEMLETIARREQEDDDRTVSLHGSKEAKTLTEQQRYVVASITEVGPVTAERLLEHFGSIRAVMNAGRDELVEVEGIGDVLADHVHDIITADYENNG